MKGAEYMSKFKPIYSDNLPDVYKKDPNSNTYKILAVPKNEIDEIKNNINAVYQSLDLDKAYGATLDLYGDMLGQKRGFASDQQYRAMIKSVITRNLMNGDINSIINAICLTFNCDPSNVHISEIGNTAVKIESLPYDIINYVGLSANQTVQLIRALVPVGVTVTSTELVGTFEFGSAEGEFDEEKGFDGGYLGELYIDDDEYPLPI